MRGGSISFTASKDGKPVALISRSGRGRGRAWNRGEASRRARAFAPDARGWFGLLRPVLLASRPIVESFIVNDYASGTTHEEFVYGAPTYRNTVAEWNGSQR